MKVWIVLITRNATLIDPVEDMRIDSVYSTRELAADYCDRQPIGPNWNRRIIEKSVL